MCCLPRDFLDAARLPSRAASVSRLGRANTALRADASEEHGEVTGCFGFGGGEPGRERQLLDVDAGEQAASSVSSAACARTGRVRRPAASSRAAGSR
jgi:hypothetical protein